MLTRASTGVFEVVLCVRICPLMRYVLGSLSRFHFGVEPRQGILCGAIFLYLPYTSPSEDGAAMRL